MPVDKNKKPLEVLKGLEKRLQSKRKDKHDYYGEVDEIEVTGMGKRLKKSITYYFYLLPKKYFSDVAIRFEAKFDMVLIEGVKQLVKSISFWAILFLGVVATILTIKYIF